jgi:hypothetical protein
LQLYCILLQLTMKSDATGLRAWLRPHVFKSGVISEMRLAGRRASAADHHRDGYQEDKDS